MGEHNETIESLKAEIDALKREVAELRDEKYHLLFEYANDSIFIIDPETRRFLDVNDNATHRLGYSRDELLGMTVDEIVTPMASKRNDAIIEELREKGSVVFEHVHLRSDGTEMPVEISSRVVQYGGRAVFQSMVRDITERKQAEHDREIADRESERLNIALMQKNEELEQIVSIFTHDLRAPLINLQGFSKSLLNASRETTRIINEVEMPRGKRQRLVELLEDDVAEALDFISIAVKRMEGLLGGLKKLSKLGWVAPELEEVDMDSVLGELTGSFGPQAQAAEAVIEVGELPTCRGDRGQIVQVFSNLLDNAIKYLDPDRPGIIRVTGSVEDGLVIYTVEDNGIGIDEAFQQGVFNIFQRFAPERAEGEGIGLTVVRKIITGHCGRVTVDSTSGKGTRFLVYLPSEEG